MVRSTNSFLIDAAFIIERIHKTFFETPLITVEGRDLTFTFGFIRDFLRLRKKLGIRKGVMVIGKEIHSLTEDQNMVGIIAILQELKIPYIHDPLNTALHIASSLRSQFSHIVTDDSRLLQLCNNDKIIVFFEKGQRNQCEWMSSETIKKVMGIDPADVPTYLALTEASKTAKLTKRQAVRLIELCGNLDSIYENLPKVASSRIQKKLVEYEGQIRQYYDESKVVQTVEPTPYNIKNVSLNNMDTENKRQRLRKYGFHSLLALLATPPHVRSERNESQPQPDSYHAVVNAKELKNLESLIRSAKICSIDTESDDKDPREGNLLGVAFSTKKGEAHFVPLIENYLKDVDKDDVLAVLKRIFDSDVNFIGHNIKYDYLLLRRSGIAIKSIHFDTMLAAYDGHGDWDFFNLGYLAQKFLSKGIKSYSDIVDEDSTFLDLPFKEMVDHACQDADVTLSLYPLLSDELKERAITEQFFNRTMQLLKRLGDLEFQGIPVNEGEIETIRQSLIEQAMHLKNDICNKIGSPFDLDSDKELSKVLKEALGLGVFPRSRRLSLSELEQLATGEPIVELIVRYKKLRSQIRGIESISAAVTDGIIHPHFNQIKTRTGLVATTRPSLFDFDTLPKLRSCFDSCVHDFFKDSQRALGILGHITQDPVLQRVRASKSKVDSFMVKHPLMKTLDHDGLLLSLVLDLSESFLSRAFLVDRLKVTTIRHDLEKRYQTMFRWLENFKREAQANGYATIDSKRKYLDGLKSSDIVKRRKALEHAVRWLIGF